ncbi:hypothetical protein BJF90_04690 [Pseudonocardia sp. CNS-004]|nr:hypothetical protein BJF90_04690 [Pseudonocardia sp. CNS-004]
MGRRRGAGVMGDEGEGRFGVQIVLRGAERIRRTGVERLLSAGDLGIWDGTGGLGIEVLAPFAKRTLVFPRELVLAASRAWPTSRTCRRSAASRVRGCWPATPTRHGGAAGDGRGDPHDGR